MRVKQYFKAGVSNSIKHGPFGTTGKIHAGHITFTNVKFIFEVRIQEYGWDN